MAKGDKIIEGNDGKYLVKCDGKGYDVISLNDNSSGASISTRTRRLGAIQLTARLRELFTFVDDTHVKMPVGNDCYQTFELSDAGVYAYQQVAMQGNFASR